MRELVFKNLTSIDHKKRDIFVEETVTRNGIVATSQRRCLYFVKNKTMINDSADLAKLSELKKQCPDKKRSFYVLKVHDSTAGTDKLMCKLKGNFYAVVGRSIYHIVFIHSFKIRFEEKVGKGK